MTTDTTGWLGSRVAVIKWTPDVIRDERINIGVSVWDLKTGEIATLILDDWSRVEAFESNAGHVAAIREIAADYAPMDKAGMVSEMEREHSCYASSVVRPYDAGSGIRPPTRSIREQAMTAARRYLRPVPQCAREGTK